MSEWEDAPTQVTKPITSSEWEDAPIPQLKEEPFYTHGFIGRIGKVLGEEAAKLTLPAEQVKTVEEQQAIEEAAKPKVSTPSVGESLSQFGKQAIEQPWETAKELGLGLLADPELLHPALWTGMPAKLGAVAAKVGAAAGKAKPVLEVVGTGVRGGLVGATAETATQLIEGKLNPQATTNTAALFAVLGSGMAGIGKAGKAGFDKFKSTKEETIPTIEQPITPEPTPEVPPVKSTVDTTLEQWQNELAVDQSKLEIIRPQEQSIIPSEDIKPTEGIPVPQEGIAEGLKPSVETPITGVDTPGKTPLAKTNKEDQIILDEPAIKTDFEAGFPYIFSPDSPTGLQKAEVFKQLGITKEQFSQLVRTPEEYSAFIKAHEESHVKNGDKTAYPRTEDGKIDLMHPDAIAIEVRATQDALNAIKKPELPLKETKLPSIYDVVDEADFHIKGKQVLKDQGPEVARKFADNYIRARGTDPILVQQNVNQFISKEIQQHGTTVETASDLIEKSANSILADSRKADIYSQSLVDRIPELGLRDRMTRALEKEKGYDKLYTNKEKHDLLYGTGKKNAVGYPDRGYVGRLEGMKGNLAKGKIPKGHTKESYAQAIEKFEIVVNRLEKLPSEEFAIPLLKEVETRLNKIGTEAKQAGLIESLRDNYVPHVLDWSKSKFTKQEQLDFMQKIQEKLATAPKDSKIIRDFTQQRKFEFLRELEKLLYEVVGTDHGVVVHTDIAKIVNAYEKAMQTAKIQKSMIDYLKINKDVHGKPWIMEDNLAAKQAGYVSFEGKGARPLQNYRVHPDLVDAMNFMFREKDPGVIVRGLGAVSHLTKALNTVGSLFHAKSLIEAGGLTSPGLMLKEIFTAGSGTKAALKALKSGDDPLIDLLIREGGLMVKVEDIQRTIVPEMGQFLDNTATKFSKMLKGPDVKLVQHITDPLDKVVLQRLNAFTWDFMHAGQKVNVAKHLFTKMKLKNPEIPDAILAKEVGDYVNSTFGGLNWLQVANSVQNKYLRALAQKTMNTTGREWAQIVMFAPDWTVSTLRAFTNALPKELSKPKNWQLVEGAKGVYNPKTKGDLARRYVVTTALSWLTLLNGVNMMLSNKPIWENKDPTRVEFKDGTSMQAAKHSMEAAHWMMNPDKTLGNKLGFWPKSLFVGATGIAYPSPDAPKLKDTSTLGRAKAIALLGAPFQVSSAIQAPEGEALKRAGLSTMGFPVYGVSKEKLKEVQKKGRLESKEKRLKEEMRRRMGE